MNCVTIGNLNSQFDSGALAGHTVNGTSPTNRGKAFFEIRQTMTGNEALTVARRKRHPLAVILDHQGEAVVFKQQTEADFRRSGM